jgi:hypothetical protein
VADLDPAELTEPVDVVAWLRALSVGTVLLDEHEPPRAWQVRPWCEYAHRADPREFAALVMAGSEEAYELGDEQDVRMVAAEGPFQVLYVPPEGGA